MAMRSRSESRHHLRTAQPTTSWYVSSPGDCRCRAAQSRYGGGIGAAENRGDYRTGNQCGVAHPGGYVRLLKALVSFIVGTVVGALGSKVFGAFGGLLGFIAGALAAWWVAQRMAFFD